MSHPYTGNPATFTAATTLPDDGEASASSVNVPFETLLDNDANLNARIAQVPALIVANTYSVALVCLSGTTVWTPGADDKLIALAGCGGGGGGGGGTLVGTSANAHSCGGGGGAGAWLDLFFFEPTYGVNYEISVGAGGAGGIGHVASPATAGSQGASSIFKIQAGATLKTWRGGPGGQACDNDVITHASGDHLIAAGGGTGYRPGTIFTGPALFAYGLAPGDGGDGTDQDNTDGFYASGFSRSGCRSLQGFNGGSGNNHGTNDSPYFGGGAGGGGGSGPFGAGVIGGLGGNASTGVGSDGGAGVSAAANTGAGGGGGGGGGAGASATANGNGGGNGGAGGSGKVILYVLRKTLP